LFYGFFNKNISDDVQHLVKIPPSPPPPKTTREKQKIRTLKKKNPRVRETNSEISPQI
jgi:hypothetical protein